MENIRICERRDAERLFGSGELNDFILSYENQYPTGKRPNLREIKDKYKTRSLADLRDLSDSYRENQMFMIVDNIRWRRYGDTRMIYQKVGENWVYIREEPIDELSEIIFKGVNVEALCTEKELREAFRSGKLKKFLTKVYQKIEPASDVRMYTIGDNFIEFNHMSYGVECCVSIKTREVKSYYREAGIRQISRR